MSFTRSVNWSQLPKHAKAIKLARLELAGKVVRKSYLGPHAAHTVSALNYSIKDILTSFLKVPAAPILSLVTTLYMGINISKPTLSATDYVVLLSGMPEMLQNSTVTWKMISIISLLCKLNSLSSTIPIIFNLT